MCAWLLTKITGTQNGNTHNVTPAHCCSVAGNFTQQIAPVFSRVPASVHSLCVCVHCVVGPLIGVQRVLLN